MVISASCMLTFSAALPRRESQRRFKSHVELVLEMEIFVIISRKMKKLLCICVLRHDVFKVMENRNLF